MNKTFLVLLFFASMFHFSALAQNERAPDNEEDVAKMQAAYQRMMQTKFEFKAPGPKFQRGRMGNSYIESGTNASIMAMLTPAPYEKVLPDYQSEVKKNGALQSGEIEVQGKTGYFAKFNENRNTMPGGEEYILLMVIIPNGETTISFNGLYPKKQDKKYFGMYMKSIKTVKVVK